MAGKDINTVLSSPFKFGFFAGLGFFFASILMSGIGVIFIFVCGIGLGTMGAVLSAAHTAGDSTTTTPPANVHRWAVSAADKP